MPQVTKGGKYIFGWSKVNDDLSIQLPQMAIDEYNITSEGKVFLISGSKTTGGFVVTRKGLLFDSKIGNILKETPDLCNYKIGEGEFVKYKGRLYCWCNISKTGKLYLNENMLKILDISIGNKLLSIRSSDIAFCMGQKGQLIERAENYEGEIIVY
ncbi:hypothetical protein [uncultured Clostridium sp.]|uniref:hypothetical protein n=1 Tax=uncultured Clostridium sp. TaxID=59620 RepID=UPI0028E9F32B|nr:hypothetical protein [uncultured Clostridium sp.]